MARGVNTTAALNVQRWKASHILDMSTGTKTTKKTYVLTNLHTVGPVDPSRGQDP